MRKYKFLFWDFDGTIVNSFEGCSYAFGKVFEHYGVNIPEAERKQFIGPPLKVTFTKMFGADVEPEATELYREYYINRGGQNMCKIFDGIDVVLKTLKESGYKMFIATSKRQDIARDMLINFGIADNFDDVFGTVESKGLVDKKDILQYAVDCSGAILAESVMIGDSIYDVMASKAVGMDCVACEYGFGNLDEMKKAGIVASSKNVMQLIELFK